MTICMQQKSLLAEVQLHGVLAVIALTSTEHSIPRQDKLVPVVVSGAFRGPQLLLAMQFDGRGTSQKKWK